MNSGLLSLASLTVIISRTDVLFCGLPKSLAVIVNVYESRLSRSRALEVVTTPETRIIGQIRQEMSKRHEVKRCEYFRVSGVWKA